MLTALTIGNFLGAEEIGTQKLAEVLADGGPSTATNEDRREFGETVAKILAARELAGGEPLQLSTAPSMEVTIRRLKQTDLERILELRDKIALIAQVGFIYLKVRGLRTFGNSVFESWMQVLKPSMRTCFSMLPPLLRRH